jgi:hypothetical protein
LFIYRGNETIKRIEAHLEVPSVSLCLTKAQFLFLTHLFTSWSATLVKNKGLPVLPKAIVGKIFDSKSELKHLIVNVF